MDHDARQLLFNRFDRITKIPMFVLALVFLAVLGLPEVLHLSTQIHRLLNRVIWLLWGIFAAELAVKIYLAPDRRRYLISHWPDVLTVAVPFLRALRLLPVIVALLRTWEQARLVLHQRTFSLIGITSLLTVVLSATIVYVVERRAAGPIQQFTDALWWAMATITTVGYGDVYPTTAVGRSVAVFLMLTGISLFGVLAARIAAFFVEEDQQARTDSRLDEVLRRLDRIERQIAQQNAHRRAIPTRDAMLRRQDRLGIGEDRQQSLGDAHEEHQNDDQTEGKSE